MTGMEGAVMGGLGNIATQAGTALAAQKLTQEANKALGQTQKSGFQASMLQPGLVEATGDIGSRLQRLKEQQAFKAAPPIDAINMNYTDRLDKVLGGVS